MSNQRKVTKSELAREMGVTPQYISKLVGQGFFDKCMTPDGKKIYLNRALETVSKGRKGNFNPKVITPSQVKADKQIYTPQTVEELEKLLLDTQSPTQKVQVVKEFWAGKINRQKFLQAEGELITIADAKATLEQIATPFNQAMDDLPFNLKARFSDTADEAVEWLVEHINEIKMDFQRQK